MASFTKKRVTFAGDNINTLMKPPCRTLEYDKDAPVSQLRKPLVKSPGPKLTRSKRAWVPRRLRQKVVDDATLLRRKHENAQRQREHQKCINIIQAIQEKRGIPKDQRCLKFTIHFA